MKLSQRKAAIGLLTIVCATGTAFGQVNPGTPKALAPSEAQQSLDQAAAEQKFTFLVFYKDGSPAARSVADVVKAGVAKRQDRAVVVFVQVTNPAERQIVARFNAGRAPMPLTLAVAPNGAITGAFPQKLTDANIDDALVSPTMTKCMKSLQDGKLVFVCVQNSDRPTIPAAVKEFQADPLYKDRVTLVSMQVRDPDETRFLDQMKIDAQRAPAVMSVLLAPPGVLIGKYDHSATKEEMAAALHKAGKCCDDANCKHNQGRANGQGQQAAPGTRPANAGRN